MLASGRLPQTILLAGPEGVGKATLARRFAATLLGDPEKIERDDLSLESNLAIIADREKWTSDKRAEDPLFFSSHPDFVVFPPEGPLRQISIQQIRLLRERAQLKPLKGTRRVFLIDQIDRANEQAANSLLKILEEPPEHLVLLLTAQNPYDLLPTIRSRAVPLYLRKLTEDEISAFARSRKLPNAERRIAIAAGSPGVAVSLDLEAFDRRRTAMLALLESASGRAPFSKWAKYSETIGASKSEKLDHYLKILYLLIEDVLLLQNGTESIRNRDLKQQLETVARHVSFDWVRRAVREVDDLLEFLRRNIQKGIALDGLVLSLREST
jgi:DNA polymerase-3 subunit delta'